MFEYWNININCSWIFLEGLVYVLVGFILDDLYEKD